MTRTAAAADAALPSNRRAFFGSSLALASLVASSAAGAAAAEPDAYLLVLGAELDRMEIEIQPFRAAYNDHNEGSEVDEAYEIRDDAHHAVMRKIAAARAFTLNGIAVKARALYYIHREGLTPEGLRLKVEATDHKLIWSILNGLLQVQESAVRS